jgi:hypothetical protein
MEYLKVGKEMLATDPEGLGTLAVQPARRMRGARAILFMR